MSSTSFIYNYNHYMDQERVQKLIAQAGITSRRGAEALIKEGKVTVDGQVAALGTKAHRRQVISVDGVVIPQKEELVYILLNKPANVITTSHDPEGRTSVLDLVQVPERIFAVGRLDYNTVGTLLLTNDGSLAHKLTHPSFAVKRIYHAKLKRPLSSEHLAYLNSDRVVIDGTPSQQRVTLLSNQSYEVTLTSGMNRHVRKLFEHLDYVVTMLNRVEFAGLSHREGLPQGKWRKLTPHEIKQLRLLVS